MRLLGAVSGQIFIAWQEDQYRPRNRVDLRLNLDSINDPSACEDGIDIDAKPVLTDLHAIAETIAHREHFGSQFRMIDEVLIEFA